MATVKGLLSRLRYTLDDPSEEERTWVELPWSKLMQNESQPATEATVGPNNVVNVQIEAGKEVTATYVIAYDDTSNTAVDTLKTAAAAAEPVWFEETFGLDTNATAFEVGGPLGCQVRPDHIGANWGEVTVTRLGVGCAADVSGAAIQKVDPD